MKVLVLNSGSSSVKYQLIETSLELIEKDADRTVARGSVERIGTASALHTYRPEGRDKHVESREILDKTGTGEASATATKWSESAA